MSIDLMQLAEALIAPVVSYSRVGRRTLEHFAASKPKPHTT